MTKTNAYGLSDSAGQTGLSQWDLNYIRLIHIFKSVVDVLIDDAAHYPWKLPMYADHVIGTWLPVTVGTGLYFALSPTDYAKKARKKVKIAANETINYDLYSDYVAQDDLDSPSLQKGKMTKDLLNYAMAQIFNSLNREILKLPHQNRLRRFYEQTVFKKRQSRALMIVS